MVRKSTRSPRILQSSIAAFALIVSAATPAFAAYPDAANDSASVVDGASVLIDVLANDTDSDGDTLQIQSVGTPSSGTAVIEANKIRYTAPSGFEGLVEFLYTINDGSTNTSTAEVAVGVTLVAPPEKEVDLFAKRAGGSAVPGAGVADSNVAEGAAFTSFGIPSINDDGEVAVLGRYKSPSEKGTVAAVFAGSPVALIAKRGDEAPNALGVPQTGVVFSSFRDPLLSHTGKVAFIAKLAGESITTPVSNALFTTAFGGELIRVIQAGDAAPGIAGATIRKITSVAIGSRSQDGEDDAIFFTAALTIGGDAAVTRADDVVLYVATKSEGVTITPVLREGESVGSGTVKSFRALFGRPGSAGQGRGVEFENGSDRALGSVLVTTSTGAKAVGLYGNLGVNLQYGKGSQAENYEDGTSWISFGVPTMSASTALAFAGTVKGGDVTLENNTAIFAERENVWDLHRIASEGELAPGIAGATFSSFRAPVNANGLRVAFAAKVRGASLADDQGIWFRGNNGLELVAREGAQPPGVPAGAKWASFTSLALSDGPAAAPMFVAKLARPKSGEENPAGILVTNSTGLWARDTFGRLHLIARYGETITVNGEEKTVRSFVALKSIAGSSAQNRFFNNQGEIYYRAICTDGTQVLIRVALPNNLG